VKYSAELSSWFSVLMRQISVSSGDWRYNWIVQSTSPGIRIGEG
jgi:hypothetical protein